MASCATRHTQSYLGQPHSTIILGLREVVLRGHVLLPDVPHVDDLPEPWPRTFHGYVLGQEIGDQLRPLQVVGPSGWRMIAIAA